MKLQFFQAEYIRIFICDLFILTNIFGYSFVIYLNLKINLDSHSSNICENEYI